LRGLTSKNDTIHTNTYSDKWTKIGITVGIFLGNNQDNFQLHRFTIHEKNRKKF